MSEGPKHGTIWTVEELDAIVADYFAMLSAELKREPYVKSRHSAALMDSIKRSHRSVEFKHQNISAVLKELGLPWIPGYRPKDNFQNAIFPAIDRYLSAHPMFFDIVPPDRTGPEISTVFVAPPITERPSDVAPPGLRRLIRKFDPAARDLRNRTLGKAGESFVLEVERKRLEHANREDLARQVRWVAFEDGDGAGYDVLSFAPTGSEYLIEVKTTNGAGQTPFFLTRNESEMAAERPAQWRIYRVHFFSTDPRIFTLQPPLANCLSLRPETWRASLISTQSPPVV